MGGEDLGGGIEEEDEDGEDEEDSRYELMGRFTIKARSAALAEVLGGGKGEKTKAPLPKWKQ